MASASRRHKLFFMGLTGLAGSSMSPGDRVSVEALPNIASVARRHKQGFHSSNRSWVCWSMAGTHPSRPDRLKYDSPHPVRKTLKPVCSVVLVGACLTVSVA